MQVDAGLLLLLVGALWAGSASAVQQQQFSATDSFFDEEPIVINSVHSGLAAKRPQADFNSSLRRPSVPARIQVSSSASSGLWQRPAHLDSARSQAAPSQDFEPSQQQQQQLSRFNPSPLFRPATGLLLSRQQPAPYAQGAKQPVWLQTAPLKQQQHQSLIRDTSQVSTSLTSQKAQANESEQVQGSQLQQAMWMQSIRDNHHGPLRSRFNLSVTSASQPRISDANILFDGHMKVKQAPSQLAAYEYQSLKSVRDSGAPPEQAGALGLRRNSKFTRQSDEPASTTPLITTIRTTQTTQADNNTQQVTTSTTRATATSTSEYLPTTSEEPATGNGRIIALNETDLLLLGQKFELGGVESSNSSEAESAPNNELLIQVSNNHSKRVGARSVRPRIKTARKLFNGDQDDASSLSMKAEARQDPVEPKQTGSTPGGRSWSRLIPNLLQRTMSLVFRRFTGGNGSTNSVTANHQSLLSSQASKHLPIVGPQSSLGPTYVSLPVPYQNGYQSLLDGALTAAAAGAPVPQRVPIKSGKQPLYGLLSMHEGNSPQASNIQENHRPLKHHANKKIIDSIVDLPASERRRSRRAARTAAIWKRSDAAIDSGDTDDGSSEDYELMNEADSNSADLPDQPQFEFRTTTESVDDYLDESVIEEAPRVKRRKTNERLRVNDDEELDPLERSSSMLIEVGEDDNEQPEEEQEEPDMAQPSIFFYAPQANLASLRRSVTNSRHKAPGGVNKRRPRPPELDNQDDEAENIRSVPAKRRRPSSSQKKRPAGIPGERRNPQVPPISLSSARPSSTAQSTQVLKPMAVFTKPQVDRNSQGSNNMSPISSSINVIDVDPSMTRLAHNKLIVAKFKPNRANLRPKSETGAENLHNTATLQKQSTVVMPPTVTTSTTKRPLDPNAHVLGLTASLLGGSQALSSSHLNDIINRWTSKAALRNTSRSEPDSTSSGLRVVQDALAPLASSLAARLGPSPAISRPIRPSSNDHSSVSAGSDSSASNSSLSSSSSGKNDKFNFSLVQMNNRERINPLLFPVENQRLGLLNNTLSKKQQTSRVKPTSTSPRPLPYVRQPGSNLSSGKQNTSTSTTATSTTTSTTSTTTTTTTTERPSSTTAETTTSTTQQPSSTRPAVTSSSSSLSAEEEFRQTLRNEHFTYRPLHLAAKPANKLSTSFSKSPFVVPSGHISLPATLEEATHDANRYVTLTEQVAGNSSDHHQMDNSIVIMSDNHHSSRRRPPPPSISKIQVKTGIPNEDHAAFTSAHGASKFLEEFVNGSRYRPSSALIASKTDRTKQTGGQEQTMLATNNHASSGHPSTISPQRASSSPSEHLDARAPVGTGSSGNGAPSIDAQDSLIDKLDNKAQAILLDIFDRDPAYSDVAQSLGVKLDNLMVENSNKSDEKQLSTPPSADRLSRITGRGDEQDQEDDARSTSSANSPTDPTPIASNQDENLREPVDTGDPSDTNNRASMRKNQLKIQAILMALANKTRTTSAVSEDPDQLDLQGDPEVPAQFVSPKAALSTSGEPERSTVWSSSSSSEGDDNPAQNDLHEGHIDTTSLYTPMKATTLAAFTTTTIGRTRQKINRPVFNLETTTAGTPEGANAVPTSKLTESPTGDGKLRQTIKDRLGVLENSLNEEQQESLGSSNLASNYPEADQQPSSTHRPPRPVIIRRRPRPPVRKPARPTQDDQELDNELDTPLRVRPASNSQKRRRRPTKKPVVLELTEEDQAYGDETSGERRPVRIKPNLVLRPSGSSVIRRRPGSGSISSDLQIQIGSNESSPQESLRPVNSLAARPAPVSIILPSSSPSRKQEQEIRTRPLMIIDPATENPLDHSLNDSIVNPQPHTRVPETTIMHNKMVVTYKPGRPLPGTVSTSGTSSSFKDRQPSIGSMPSKPIEHEEALTGEHMTAYLRPGRDNMTLITSGLLSGSTLVPANQTSASSTSPRPVQLGSGNGGDTYLVSMEQQASSRPPPAPTTVSQLTMFEQVTSGTNTTPPAPFTALPHRPIIVINGLFDGPSSQNSSIVNQHEHSRPRPSRPSATNLVEAGSMSVVAAASHGHSTSANSSRPWYPTSNQSGRPGAQGAGLSSSTNNSTSSEISTTDSSGSSSNQNNQIGMPTGDPVNDPFGLNEFIATSSTPAPSGSYQNHHHQNTQHIGMPYLGQGGSLSSANRPNAMRPYRWRVKKRPSGNNHAGFGGPNGVHHDHYPSGSTSSSFVYRPIGDALGQLVSVNTIIALYDNVLIFFARLRTFLISLMVMFLPPLALTAGVVSAMSS